MRKFHRYVIFLTFFSLFHPTNLYANTVLTANKLLSKCKNPYNSAHSATDVKDALDVYTCSYYMLGYMQGIGVGQSLDIYKWHSDLSGKTVINTLDKYIKDNPSLGDIDAAEAIGNALLSEKIAFVKIKANTK